MTRIYVMHLNFVKMLTIFIASSVPHLSQASNVLFIISFLDFLSPVCCRKQLPLLARWLWSTLPGEVASPEG